MPHSPHNPARPADTLVSVDNVSFGYGPRAILSGLDMQITRGSVVVVMGPSGCGKSTLLGLIGGRLAASAGRVFFDGADVAALRRRELFALRKRMGMLFQSSALLTDLSVFDNVAFPLREHCRLPESLVRNLVLMKLHMVGLRGARDLRPAELSGGMARRVALARAIALDPELILYDEPFAGLDPVSLGVTLKLIRELNDALRLTSVVVTHDVDEGCRIADYMYLLGRGTIIGRGTPQEMLHSGDPEVAQFMQGMPDGPVPFHYPAPDYRAELLDAGGHS